MREVERPLDRVLEQLEAVVVAIVRAVVTEDVGVAVELLTERQAAVCRRAAEDHDL